MIIQIILLLLILKCNSLVLKQQFTGSVAIDNIAYNIIVVPRHAKYISIDIWANKFIDSPPVVFLKYNGYPTLLNYDDMFIMPKTPLELTLLDGSPTESFLYIGIWGGKLLHSYRYFAGTPEDIVYGIESTIESCDDQLMNGDDCSMLEKIPSSIHGQSNTYKIDVDTPQTFALPLPNGLEKVLIQVSLDSNELSQICNSYLSQPNSPNEILELVAYVYLDQLDEEFDGGHQHFPISLEYICNNMSYVELAKGPIINLNLMLPIAGTWRVTLLLYKSFVDISGNVTTKDLLNNQKSQSRWRRLASKAQVHKQANSKIFEQSMIISTNEQFVKSLQVTINVTLITCRADYMGSSEQYEIHKFVEYTNFSVATQSTDVKSESKTYINNCVLRVNPMVSMTSSESSSQGYLTLKSDYVMLGQDWVEESVEIYNNTDVIQTSKTKTVFKNIDRLSQPYTVFAAKMDHVMPIGGGLQIQLYVKPNVTGTELSVLNELEKLHFRLSLRFGAMPVNPDLEKLDEASLLDLNNDGQLIPANGITLSTRDAFVRHLKDYSIDNDYDDDDDSRDDKYVDGALYIWTLIKPRLPGMMSSNNLYARVMLGKTDIDISSFSFNISTTLTFEPCPTESCVHGTCEIHGTASSCACKYPWAGETCEELGTPYWYFVIQVLCLVLSNLSMVPAIIFSYFHGMPLFSILLASSATSSALYHLCDTDVWCINQFSFKALQIQDFLFSIVCVSAVIFHHCPLSSNTHSALVICIISILISPVSNDPTNPDNVITAIVLSISICIFAWTTAVLTHRFPYLNKNDNTWRLNPGIKSPSNIAAKFAAATKGYAPVSVIERGSRNDIDNIEMKHVSESNDSNNDSIFIDNNDNDSNEDDVFDNNESDGHHEIETSREITNNWTTISVDSVRINWFEKIKEFIKSIRWTLVGVALSAAGIVCFSLQTRSNYWMLHSLWHFLVMLSVLPLLYGRGILVNKIASCLHLPIGGNAAIGRPGY